ncbi:MAG: hypothetical protein ACRDM9_13940, partial [Gaiellaceae bacterium]
GWHRCSSSARSSSSDVRPAAYAQGVRLRRLSEAECYARCYGATDDTVRVIRLPRPREQLRRLSGEQLRRLFEERLDGREQEAA